MSSGLGSIVFPVDDLEKGKAIFTALFGQGPHTDTPYYVGYNVNGLEIALNPNARAQGQEYGVSYWTTADMSAEIERLVAAGAGLFEELQLLTDLARLHAAGVEAVILRPRPDRQREADGQHEAGGRTENACGHFWNPFLLAPMWGFAEATPIRAKGFREMRGFPPPPRQPRPASS